MAVDRIIIYPDTPAEIESYIVYAGLKLRERIETNFAYIFVADKEWTMPNITYKIKKDF